MGLPTSGRQGSTSGGRMRRRRTVDTGGAPARGAGVGVGFALPVLLGPVLNPLNTTMISVALVPIADALHITSATVIWLVVSLYLASAVSQPVMGSLADLVGPRKVYVAGMVVVLVASAIPLLWHTFPAVLAARVLLGVGTSAAYPAGMTLIRHRTQRLGIATPPALLAGLSLASLATAAVGPVLGGVLIAAFGWESIFVVNLPLAALTLVLVLVLLPADAAGSERPAARLRDQLDPVGIALFAATTTSLLFFLLRLQDGLYWLVAVSAVAAVALVLWELRHRRPFVDVRLIATNGALTRTYIRMGLTYLGPYIVVYAMSQWLQDDLGLDSDTAGLVQFPSAVLAGVASLAIARTTRVRLPLVVAAIVPLAGGLLLVVVTSASPLWLVVVAATLFGIPQGLGAVANQAVVYRHAPVEQIGSAAGLSRTAVSLTAILSSALIGLTFDPSPSDAGLHLLGWVVVGAGVLSLLMTVLDRSLSADARP